ncbi:MAG: ABC transporter substrate-binding protein [Actinobacteria bacterium]|nr:ABC transporter substrate-binding protein [Actinomycetota bacterium]
MRKRRAYLAAACVAVLASLVAAGFAAGGSSRTEATKVTVQLKWVTQAQFAGFYAAQEKGYYKQLGLDVTIKLGGPDIIPEQVVLGRQAEFGVNWLPSLFSNREGGNDLVNIAQLYARSGTTEVTWKDSGLNSIKKLEGKKYGVWIFGNEFEQQAALVKAGLDPKKDVTLVKQNFDMVAFLKREIDAASAMTYNELAQVLESKNPKTGKLYTLKDLNVFKMSELGVGMLQDGIFVRGDWIADKANQATAVKFLQATFRGWAFCRDNYRACVNIVLEQGTALPRGHQTWQMNEVNALIWPNRLGIGIMDPVEWKRTNSIATKFKVIKKPATVASYRADLARKAVSALRRQGVDVNGKKWKKAVVVLREGGK